MPGNTWDINLNSSLPDVASPLTVDGATQAGYSATNKVRIGANSANTPWFVEYAPDMVLNGLDFSYPGAG